MPGEAESHGENRLLQLAPQDNVLIALADLEPGDWIRWEDRSIQLTARIPLGHKVAAQAIPAGSKIIKYGVPIGTATESIAFGCHVHTHNLRSDYLPTYLHADQSRFFRDHP
jgi:altronate dehydratase small subunit